MNPLPPVRPVPARAVLPTLALALGSAACAAGPPVAGAEHAGWPLRVDGALRAMMHEGRTEAVVRLDALLPDPSLQAVGALAGLEGEVTIVDGVAVLTRPVPGTDELRTEARAQSDAGAALLVSARVPAWVEVETERPLGLDELDAELPRLAERAGLGPGRFPFRVDGGVEDLAWHVIDGSRLPAGSSSHEEHRSAAVRGNEAATVATVVGFWSPDDQGVFTHMGSRAHLHCVLRGPDGEARLGAHVDGITLPAGSRLRFPAPRPPGR